jgi:hypothetical protein
MENRTLDIEQQLHAELAILTTAQSELDQAMATVTPIQLRVDESQAKVATLMTELQTLLNVQPGPPSLGRPTGRAAAPPQSAEMELSPTKLSRKTRRGSKPSLSATSKRLSVSKKRSQKKVFPVESRIRLARSAAEMQARKKGLSPRLVKKAGDAMEAKKRAEFGA